MKKITFRQFAITICLLCALIMFLAYKSLAQAEIGFHFDYSAKYHAGAGIEGGAWIDNSYIGANTLFYFNRERKNPVSVNAKYGYNINGFVPFAIAGYYTSGGESIKDGEGVHGFEYGGGLSYQFKDSPIKFSSELTNLKAIFSISLIHFL